MSNNLSNKENFNNLEKEYEYNNQYEIILKYILQIY